MSFSEKILEFITPKTKQYEVCKMASEGLTNAEIAVQLGIGESYVRSAKTKANQLAAKRGYSPQHDMTHPTADGYTVKGVSTLYGADGEIKQQWVKTQQDKEQQLEAIQEVIASLADGLPKYKPSVKHDIDYQDMLAVYPLGDPHVGVAAYKTQMGVDWGLKETEEVLTKTFGRVVKSAPSCKQAVIVNLGDYYHSDNVAGVTSRNGHKLDVDLTYQDMVDAGLRIMISMITNALDHHETVSVITTIGNHDDCGAMFLQVALKHIYANDDRVDIVCTSDVFQYIEFGKCLIGVHHGHTCKGDKLPMVMATDKYELWGRTQHRMWLTGHIHHDTFKEYSGCTVESFRTMNQADNYAHSGGYRAGKDTKVLVLDKEHGEIERHTINISQVMS